MSRELFTPVCEDLARWIADPPPERPPVHSAEEWDRFHEAARVHGVAPLLWTRVRDLPDWAASSIGDWLRDQHQWNGCRSARLQTEIIAILAAFAAVGVPILPLKGAVLSTTIYEEPAARPMADIDVLLPAEHQEAGEAVLIGLGYEKVFNGWKHARFVRPGAVEVVDAEREHPDNPRNLEVHPRCRERIRDEVVDLTDLIWGTARQGELLGVRTLLPDSDAAWLHLLIHATHHVLLNTLRLIQLVDLVRLAPAVRDPEGLTGSVDPRAVYPALALLGRYFPDERWTGLREPLRSRLEPAFATWADGLDLFTVCYLNPVPWRAEP